MEREGKLRAVLLIGLVLLAVAVLAEAAFAAGRGAGLMASARQGVIAWADHPPTIWPT